MKGIKTFLFLCFLFVFSFTAEAKKFKSPKWKQDGFVATGNGIRANILKPGKDPKPESGDNVRLFFTRYNYKTHAAEPAGLNIANLRRGDIIHIDKEDHKLASSIMMLGTGGEGFFICPAGRGQDSVCYYVRLLEIYPGHSTSEITGDTVQTDSVSFTLPDPDQYNRGDSIIQLMKLVEAPHLVSCGTASNIVAFKFRMTWFENGVQHKDILVYVECPETFGSNYFVTGGMYMVTAIPLSENRKKGKTVFNQYSGEKLESYWGLVVTKK